MLCVYLPMTAQLTAEQQNHRTFIRHDGATARAVVAAQQLRAAVVRLRARQHALPARGGGGDAGDYACKAVDARSGAVVFTAVTTLTVSGDFTRRSTLGHCVVRF